MVLGKKLVDHYRVKCPKKQKLEKEGISCRKDKRLLVKIDIVIFLCYFVEKLFLNFMFKRI